MAKVAFLGLGVMGFPMARHLAAKGHDVTVYNRTTAKAEAWVKAHGGGLAKTPHEAASGQDMVFACVGNDDDLRQVTIGPEGAFQAMAKDTVFVDHTTASAEVARELYAKAKEHGVAFIDAPVSGGQAGAENGVLTVMCGGDADIYARVEPVIMSFARMCKLLGPSGAGQLTKMVFACVGNDDDLRQVTIGPEGAFQAMAKDTVFVDHTTASAEVARELYAKAKEHGVAFIDAPVSGGQAGAENGVLTVMCGGDADIYARVEPVIMSFARMCKLLGPSGAGQLTKMVNQICIAGLVQGLAEGVNFAKKAGLDVEAVIETISKGAAQSWQMENRYKTMNQSKFDFGFAVDWMRKDLGICIAESRRNGAQLPVTALVDQFYGEVQGMGGGRWDTSSLLARLERK